MSNLPYGYGIVKHQENWHPIIVRQNKKVAHLTPKGPRKPKRLFVVLGRLLLMQ
jgi:hypothetical protein